MRPEFSGDSGPRRPELEYLIHRTSMSLERTLPVG
jgi:hypothetical protein